MNISPRRLAAVVLCGVLGATLLSLGTLAYLAGWSATKRQLVEMSFSAETAVWPVLSRAGLLAVPSATSLEREVWTVIISEYAQGPMGKSLPIAVNPVADWPKQARESPTDLGHRIIDGWSPHRQGCPAAATAVHDFLIRNTRLVPVAIRLPPGSKFVPYSEYVSFNQRSGWEAFASDNHVEAYLTVSRVGSNMLGTRVLIYIELSCGPLCGHGMYYIFEKRNGRWVRVAEQLRWIA